MESHKDKSSQSSSPLSGETQSSTTTQESCWKVKRKYGNWCIYQNVVFLFGNDLQNSQHCLILGILCTMILNSHNSVVPNVQIATFNLVWLTLKAVWGGNNINFIWNKLSNGTLSLRWGAVCCEKMEYRSYINVAWDITIILALELKLCYHIIMADHIFGGYFLNEWIDNFWHANIHTL